MCSRASAEPAAALAVIGHAASERAETLSSLKASDVRLPTMDGSDASVYDYSGRKRLVVSFASWCGCRYDLPVWQQLQEKYSGKNFSVVRSRSTSRPRSSRRG